MANTDTIFVKIDSGLKNRAEMILSSLGLTASQAINVFYKQITFQQGIPFPVKLPEKQLNADSILAMEETELREYDNPEGLYKELKI